MPLGMALATGVEAPSDAIAQLPQLRDRGRRLFGRMTLWLMVAIVGGLTIALAALAVRLGVGLPADDSTLLAGIARAAAGDGLVFGVSGRQRPAPPGRGGVLVPRGSGVLKALALVDAGDDGLLPRRLGRENRFLVAHWGVIAILGVAAAMIVASGATSSDSSSSTRSRCSRASSRRPWAAPGCRCVTAEPQPPRSTCSAQHSWRRCWRST